LAKHADQNVKAIGGVPLPAQFGFKKMGQSGTPVSEVFDQIGQHVDDIAVINSMHTNIPSHEFATVMMNTGAGRMVKPSMGSWMLYGLGTENQNLPGYIVLGSGLGGAKNWRSAFLPGAFQGALIPRAESNVERTIANIKNYSYNLKEQREQLDLLKTLNQQHQAKLQEEADLEARIQSFELAFKMQTAATDAFDFTKENKVTRNAYGDTETGRRMLTARRLVERGVRFVQVWHNGWDHHTALKENLTTRANEANQPIAALLADLKERGMLEDTLVIWGGEFGRTIYCQGKLTKTTYGRDHHPNCFTYWLAGGGVRGGITYGETDDYSVNVAENPVHVHDLQATILHQLGIDHERLTYRHQGRHFRLTDVFGKVVKDVLA